MNLHQKLSLALTALMLALTPYIGSAAEITGAGSTFVYPILAKWADSYKKEAGTAINYQSIGSGGGIRQIQGKTVDFGATDMPLKPEELEKEGLLQFPIISGAIVPIINVAGIENGKLKLTGEALADIYLGKIKKWNDPAIAALNKGLTLPDKAIVVVHRSDGSGTSFIWTNYLSKISSEWKEKVGEGTSVNWPTGVGGKGNEGVASYVKQIAGSIGYVEFAYALQNKLNSVSLKNSTGIYVEPNAETFSAAISSADWNKAKDFYLILTNAPGKKSWPIAGSTFVLMHKVQSNPEHAKETIKFFQWAYKNGASAAHDLHYVPLPSTLTQKIEKIWKEQLKTATGTPVAVSL